MSLSPNAHNDWNCQDLRDVSPNVRLDATEIRPNEDDRDVILDTRSILYDEMPPLGSETLNVSNFMCLAKVGL